MQGGHELGRDERYFGATHPRPGVSGLRDASKRVVHRCLPSRWIELLKPLGRLVGAEGREDAAHRRLTLKRQTTGPGATGTGVSLNRVNAAMMTIAMPMQR